MLKAKKPKDANEVGKERKPKFMVSGKAGVGKTMFALEFPNVYYIDSEGGAVREQYQKKLIENGGAYMGKDEGSQNIKNIIEEIKELATTKHDYKTLVIDSFSHIYNLEAAIAEERVGNDFGKDKKEANRPTRQLIRWLESLDMTVILIAHQKEKWSRVNGQLVNEGTTFDGFDKLEFILDLWIEIKKDKGSRKRTYEVKKSRIESFIEGTENPLGYQEFAELYGKAIIEKEAVPVNLAMPEQVETLNTMLKLVTIPADTVEKWKTKCGVENFDEMTSEQIQKCIDYVKGKVEEISPAPKAGKKMEVVR